MNMNDTSPTASDMQAAIGRSNATRLVLAMAFACMVPLPMDCNAHGPPAQMVDGRAYGGAGLDANRNGIEGKRDSGAKAKSPGETGSTADRSFSTSRLGRLAAAMAPGTFAELPIDGPVSNCDAFVPPSGNGTILEFTDEALWNPVSREIYIMGTARPYGVADQQFITYSERTNAWTIREIPDGLHFGFHGYDHGVLDPSTGDYYRAKAGQPQHVWRLDHATQRWEKLPIVPTASVDQVVGFELFPEMGAVVWLNARNGGERFVYTRASNRWERAELGVPFGSLNAFSEYDAVHHVLFFGGGNNYNDTTPDIDEGVRLYGMDAGGGVTRLADAPVRLGQFGFGPVQTIDPVTGKMLVFPSRAADAQSCQGNVPVPIYEYDPTTDNWGQAGVHQLMDNWCRMFTAAVPLYDHGVVFMANFQGAGKCSVLLYKHSGGG
jgi:hypothetical protein